MGFDVTWHPISQVEMHQWYFDRLEEARRGNYIAAMRLANQYRMGQAGGDQEQCRKAYRGMLEQGAQMKPDDPFDKTHSFLLAMVQGMFRTYYYTRGGIYSALAEMTPEMADYTLPFQEILGDKLQARIGIGPIRNRIFENYCGGVYIPEDQVSRLLADYESGKAEEPLKQCFGPTLAVFLKALLHAKKEGVGLLEATDVVQPDPLDLHATTCRSYLTNCDLDGVKIYAETARHQLEQAIKAEKEAAEQPQAFRQPSIPAAPPAPEPVAPKKTTTPKTSPKKNLPKKAPPKKKGLFGRLFGGR